MSSCLQAIPVESVYNPVARETHREEKNASEIDEGSGERKKRRKKARGSRVLTKRRRARYLWRNLASLGNHNRADVQNT